MNEHPDPLLADLAEGNLDEALRPALDEHLASCERCREELRLAEGAIQALRGLPEVPEPAGIPLAIRRETRGAPRRSWRAVGIAAVAAGLIGVGAVVVSSIDDVDDTGGTASQAEPRPAEAGGGAGGGAEDAEGGGSTAPELAGEAPAVEGLSGRSTTLTPLLADTDRAYDAGDLSPIGRRFRDQARRLLEEGLAPTATAFYEEFRVEDLDPRTRQAYRCVIAEVPPEQLVVPFSIESATFDGQPAYVAAFLQGPTPGERYDRVVIWVVDRDACSLLSLATQRL